MNDALSRAKAAIASVTLAPKVHAGTAFCIGPGHALTALHVVADTTQTPPSLKGPITLRYDGTADELPAAVVPGFYSVSGDWAVLECLAPSGVEPLEPLVPGGAVGQGAPWLCYGFPEIAGAGMAIGGIVRDPQSHGQLQLLCDEASAGLGPRLNGFSGAPCLVDGQAVGVMRRALVEETIDADGQRQLHTRAGTAYATPCTEIRQWQQAQRRALLPGLWGPRMTAGELLPHADFLVLLSSREPRTDSTDENDRLALRDVAQRAHEILRPGTLGPPQFAHAADIVASPELLEACIVALCRARAVVFDASGWEPAVMLLAGIRAVCRRGVTLLSMGGDCVLGDELGVPHNVKDANLVVHSNRQSHAAPGGDSVTLLGQRLQRGLAETHSPLYLDLPVYDAIRQLPPERRGVIADEDGVLVLCAFKALQQAFWKDRLRPALEFQLRQLRTAGKLEAADANPGVARSFELNSPRLVTQAVYEAIRRMQTCVVDLTGWSPNVLFELGVRLAASNQRSVCIIDGRWAEMLDAASAAQCRSLVALLVGSDFVYRATANWQGQAVFGHAYGRQRREPPPLLRQATVHHLVERWLDLATEPASRSVVDELLAQAELFSREPGPGGRSKPVTLFPGHRALTAREEEAEFERLVAAWLVLQHRHGSAGLLTDAALRRAFDSVHTALLARHAGRLDAPLAADLAAMQAALAGPSATLAHDASPLSAARDLKARATAARNSGDFAGALAQLDEALALLQGLSGADVREQRDVQDELADTYGVKGGVLRRQGDPAAALAAYRAGEPLEEASGGTYNLSNVIVLRIQLEGESPADPALQGLLDRAIRRLEQKVNGNRCDEWWAWSDLALFRLLSGQPGSAREAYDHGMRNSAPTADYVASHVGTLNALAMHTATRTPAIAADLLAAATELATRV